MKLADHLRLIGLDNVLKHRSMSKKVNKFYMKINSVGQFKKKFWYLFSTYVLIKLRAYTILW